MSVVVEEPSPPRASAGGVRVRITLRELRETSFRALVASGAHAATAAEKAFLDDLPDTPVRGFTTLTGHLKEAQFPFAIGLAALAVARGELFPPIDAGSEKPAREAPEAVLATAVGFHRFEGMALVSGAGGTS